eukprot:gene3565-biopygen3052
MKSKDQVLQKFKEYEAMVTNVTGKKIKVFRSDNGGEYSSRAFDEFLASKGIVKQRSIPRTPQQNGVAERMNRTIQESARSMLHDAELPYIFWAEAVATAVILRNRSPIVSVENMTPYESFNGRKPDVSHFKVFGCDAYMHIAKEERRKWDPKSKKCVFIGYSLHSKGYRLKKTNDQHAETPVISQPDVCIDNSEQETEDKETVADMQIDPGANGEDNQNAENVVIPRRSNRIRKVPERNGCITGDWWEVEDSLHVSADESQEEPTTIQQALNSPAKGKWKAALDSEYSSLMKNEAWNLVQLPQGRKPIGCRWVFKIKHHADGSIERYKARLVAKGTLKKLESILKKLTLQLHDIPPYVQFLP